MSDFVSAAEKPRLRPVEHLFAVIEAGHRGVFQAPPRVFGEDGRADRHVVVNIL